MKLKIGNIYPIKSVGAIRTYYRKGKLVMCDFYITPKCEWLVDGIHYDFDMWEIDEFALKD